MKNGMKFKIDASEYMSSSFPVALYRYEPGRWFGGWKHVESYRSVAEARAAYDAMADEHAELPILL